MRRFRKRFPLLIGVCLLFLPASVSGDDFDFETLQSNIKKTIQDVRPAVVRITGRGSTFSGVIVSPEGHVLSAAHAVSPGSRYQLTLPDGRRFRGIGKGSNSRTDSALILISRPGDDLPYVPMGDSSALVADQPCVSLSFPGGQKAGTEPVIRFGHIVRSGRNRRGGFLQSSALMEPGDSGGPLFDLNGCVVGIHSRIGTGMTRNFEVPVNLYRDFWNELNREANFEDAGIPKPKLGVYCEVSDDGGLLINSVIGNSIAQKAGVKRDDRVLKINGEDVDSLRDLQRVLVKARDEEAESLTISYERGEETVEVEVDFDVERKPAPEVELPPGDRPEVPDPKGFRELRSLAKQLSDLESKLDDACVEITSDFDEDNSRTITGVRIRDTKWVISKNTVVFENPKIEIGDETFPLTVAYRAVENDLVLLESEAVHKVGIELPKEAVAPELGTFLLSPDADSVGRVSVLGISAFTSRKQQSRGFMGVSPSTFQRNQGVRLDQIVAGGAAERAGFKKGDVVTKMNDTDVRTQRDLRTFLFKESPNGVVKVTLLRDDEEMIKSIRLGAPTSTTGHAADRMKKSERRDGFQQVYSHDADLDPDECGGPVFDLDGNFIGLNIARNSRVRCYAVPSSEIIDLIQQGKSEEQNSED